MLKVRALSVSYGQHRALEDVSAGLDAGEIVVILGANGAGKSTLLKAIAGICEGQVSGEILMDGIDIGGMQPHEIVAQGIALVPEGRGIFPQLTVQENLALGAHTAHARDEAAGNLERVYTLFPKLRERHRQVVRTMSGGEQQMVAIGRAMMSHPRILMLDEPSLGLSPILCKELFQSLKAVRDSGIGILLVEQNARQSLAISDRGYLLENGHIVHHDSAEELARDPAVQRAYLGAGGRAAPAAPSRAPASATPAPAPASALAAPAAAPRRPAGPSPAEIAAAALAKVTAPPPPKPAPAAATPVQAPPPRPAPAPPPQQPPLPAAAPAPPAARRSMADEMLGLSIAELVARAERKSAATASPRNGPSRPAAPAPRPSAPTLTQTPMPDLSASGADRLRAALAEIEQAARRAEAYRPGLGRKS